MAAFHEWMPSGHILIAGKRFNSPPTPIRWVPDYGAFDQRTLCDPQRTDALSLTPTVELAAIDVATREERLFANMPRELLREAAWSPDRNKIAFAQKPDADPQAIYVANPDGSGQRRLTRQ